MSSAHKGIYASIDCIIDGFEYGFVLFELLRAMLESSAMIFYLQNNRKTLLTHLIMDHGIWKDIQAWKECIDTNIKIKMKESSERMKKRQLAKASAS